MAKKFDFVVDVVHTHERNTLEQKY